jgi:hypothetical protein
MNKPIDHTFLTVHFCPALLTEGGLEFDLDRHQAKTETIWYVNYLRYDLLPEAVRCEKTREEYDAFWRWMEAQFNETG